MKRVLALLLFGCATPPPPRAEISEREKKLVALETAAANLRAFRALYELRDETTGEATLLEIAFRGPEGALLRYSGSHHVAFDRGVCRLRTETPRAAYYEVSYLEEFRRTQERYAEALRIADEILGEGLERAPQILFELGGRESLHSPRSLKASVTYSTYPFRFAWLRELRDPAFVFDGRLSFRRDGDGIASPSVEVVLEEHGLLARARVLPPPVPGQRPGAGFTLDLKSLSLEPPPDETFQPPAKGEATDQSSQALEQLRSALADTLERSLLELMAMRFSDRWSEAPREGIRALFAAYYRVDLERTYDPAGMVSLVRDGQEKNMEYARREIEKSADKATTRRTYLERLRIQRETNLSQIDEFEERIQGDYRRYLSKTLRRLRASGDCVGGLLDLSSEGLNLMVQDLLRAPVTRVLDDLIAQLEKESHP